MIVSRPAETHYQTLGVTPCASNEDIRVAFIALARNAHPDAGGTDDRMAEINRAYTTLKNDRKAYNLWLQMTRDRCPKCKGKGLVASGFKEQKLCPSCNGVGYNEREATTSKGGKHGQQGTGKDR